MGAKRREGGNTGGSTQGREYTREGGSTVGREGVKAGDGGGVQEGEIEVGREYRRGGPSLPRSLPRLSYALAPSYVPHLEGGEGEES